MKKIKLNTLTLVVFTLSSSVMYSFDWSVSCNRVNDWLRANNWHNTKIIAGCGVAAGIVGGLVWLLSRGKSDQQILEDAIADFKQIKNRYQKVVMQFEKLINVNNLDSLSNKQKDALISTIDEKVLNNFTTHDVISGWKLELSILPEKYKKLNAYLNELQARIARKKKNNTDKLLYKMKETAYDIDDFLLHLNLLRNYLLHHKNYFYLQEITKSLAKKYEQEYVAITRDQRDSFAIIRTIKRRVLTSYPKSTWPYINYFDQLTWNISSLKSLISNAQSHSNTHVYRAAQQFLSCLNKFKEIVVVNLSEYRNDIQRKRQHENEQARIKAEKEKAAAEREKARAMQEQARAMHRRANAAHWRANQPHVQNTVFVNGN